MSVLITSFPLGGDDCRMNLPNFRKHVFQKLLVISGSNFVDVLVKVSALNIYAIMVTSFPLWGFGGMGFFLSGFTILFLGFFL